VSTTEAAAFDYVIIGGGSAGSVVASRIAAAQPAATVLLIEAGPDGRGVAQIVDPPQWPKLCSTSLDWGYAYAPSEHVYGRAIPVARGRVLGGCSAVNAMQWFRGHPADYDAWEEAGATGWNYSCLLPYFRRSESWEGGASSQRGDSGPMRVTRPKDPHPVAAALVAGAAELGLPKLDDPNSGETRGATLSNLNIAEGRRFSVLDGYLPAWAPPPAPGQVPVGAWVPAPAPPPNLTVLTGSAAIRLGFGNGNGSAASRCTSVLHTVRGALRRTHARQEVILALGAFGTPELLIKSGIGDPERLRALDLDVVAALAGVGQNLQDHPLLTGPNFRARQRLGLRRDNGDGAIMNWCSGQAHRPDLHAVAIQGGVPDAPYSFAICPGLTRPASRGSLTVRDAAACGPAAVEVRSGFLAERRDVDALAEAIDMVMDLAATSAYAEVIERPLMPAGRLSEKEKEAFIRENCSTFFHPCGTAAIGSVVDLALNVIGVTGLRIVDASVFPSIPSSNTQAAVVAVAERAADLVLGTGS